MITKVLDASVVAQARNLYSTYYSKEIKEAHTKLKSIDTSRKTSHEQEVLKWIIKEFDSILFYTPEEQQKHVARITKSFPNIFWDETAKNGDGERGRVKRTTPFCLEIQNALSYTTLRGKIADKLHAFHKVKVCPYCNAHLAIVARRVNGKNSTKFELDHFFPKARHPWLSLSFFNLIPSCGNCNSTKNSDDVSLSNDFHLYNKVETDPFFFELDPNAKAQYLNHWDKDKLKFVFKENKGYQTGFANRHDESFDITGIYLTQLDIVEELIQKSVIYNAKYKKQLKGKLNKLNRGAGISVENLIVGNYTSNQDVHQRPFSKFMHDIALGCGLIKK